MCRELYFDTNNIFGSATNFCLCYAPANLEKLTFCSAYFLLISLSWNLTAFLLCHIVRTHIVKVTASLFLSALSELYEPKKYFTLFIIPYLFTSSLFPFGVFQTDRLTDKILPPLFLSHFFSLSTRGPTCRCSSIGLAKLWDGWPIELGMVTQKIC